MEACRLLSSTSKFDPDEVNAHVSFSFLDFCGHAFILLFLGTGFDGMDETEEMQKVWDGGDFRVPK